MGFVSDFVIDVVVSDEIAVLFNIQFFKKRSFLSCNKFSVKTPLWVLFDFSFPKNVVRFVLTYQTHNI